MGKTCKFLTNYPKNIKKEAKKVGVKIPKAELRLLDQLMMAMELEEFPQAKVVLNADSEQLELHLKTTNGADICMEMYFYNTDCIGFTARAARISKGIAELVGKKILDGSFIDNYLNQQITLEDVDDYYSEIVMRGQPWICCKSKYAVSDCIYYLLCFIEEVNQVYKMLKDKTQFPVYDVRITTCGENKVKVIKVIREFIGCSLREAKDIVDGVPEAIIHTYSASEFLCIQMKLKEAGAVSEMA